MHPEILSEGQRELLPLVGDFKAAIPAAGFGTRFLPLTKAQPKEMLSVVDRPTSHLVEVTSRRRADPFVCRPEWTLTGKSKGDRVRRCKERQSFVFMGAELDLFWFSGGM